MKELICVSRSIEGKIRNQGSRKIHLFAQAKKLVEPHIPVTNLDEFSEGFRNYLYSQLKERSRGALDSLGYAKVIGLYDLGNLDEQLRRLEIEYKKLSNIQLNKDYTELAPYDAGIYAITPEEKERLKEFKHIEKAIEGLIKKGTKIHYGNLSRAFHPVTQINGQRLEVNVNYVKGYNTL